MAGSTLLRHLLPAALLAGCIAAAQSAVADEPAGTWSGQWVRDGSALAVDMTFSRTADGYDGSFSSRQLRVAGIPLTRVRYEPPALRWEIVGDRTISRFEGTLAGDTLSGEFTEGSAKGTFALTRSQSAAPQLAERDVTFTNGSVKLSGTIVSPPGAGPFPGIVMLHGSGPEGRWASRYLAEEFARHGVAALIYDKRGVGKSGGDWRTAEFRALVGDASAAVETLRSQSKIAPEGVGIHGHSQGGTYAPSVAAGNAHVAFVVASAASGVSMAEAETYSLENALAVTAMPAAEKELAQRYVRAVVAAEYEGLAHADLRRAWEEVRTHPWAFEPPKETDPFWAFSRANAAYDPIEQWRRVRVPALLLYGEKDARVPGARSAARIKEAYGGPRLDIITFPLGDHGFRVSARKDGAFAWPNNAPGYPERLVEWVLDVSRRSQMRAVAR